jgi:orotidine-5'-phosphate decarboxylase
VEAAVDMDVELLTVHAAGGTQMLEAAVAAADGRLRLLAVTLLTSLDADEVRTLWDRDEVQVSREVLRLARMARSAGVAGVVSSALEAADLRRVLGPEAVLVTPGIRLSGGPRHDQTRVATPAEAVAAGSDFLVVGRAITAADDPAAALDRVLEEMEGVE